MPSPALIIRLFLCLLFIFLPMDSFDLRLYDFCFSNLPRQIEPDQHIVLVQMNDSLVRKAMGSQIPSIPLWRQSGLRNYSKIYTEAQELLLQKILEMNPQSVVFTSFYEKVESKVKIKPKPWQILFPAALSEEFKLVLPPVELASGDNYGYASLFPGQDGVLRHIKLAYGYSPSLALRTFRILNQSTSHLHLQDDFWIFFRGEAGGYPYYSAQDIVSGSLPPSALEGKIVFLGESSIFSPEFTTPRGKMSRMEVLASVLDNLLHGSNITYLPQVWGVLCAAVVTLISFFILMQLPLSVAGISLISLGCAVLLLAYVTLFYFSLWLPIANALFSILGTYLLLLGYKLSKEEEKSWKFQQETQFLKELDHFKNNFISLFSHDLKTPVAKINAVLSRLLSQSSQLSAEQAKDLKTIHRTNQDLGKTISDILKVTKMESASIKPNVGVVDLNRIVEHQIKKLKFFAQQKKMTFELQLETLFSIDGDSDLIAEIVQNLIENAIKYSPVGSKVLIETFEKEEKVFFQVKDEGQGIPPDEIPKLVEKFFRGSKNEDGAQGSGLGLYLSNFFVKAHGGELTMSSDGKSGATVGFWLPLEQRA